MGKAYSKADEPIIPPIFKSGETFMLDRYRITVEKGARSALQVKRENFRADGARPSDIVMSLIVQETIRRAGEGRTANSIRGTVMEDAVEKDPETGKVRNPNNRRRAHRLTVAEMYHRQGHLTRAQMNAATRLLDAYEGRQKSPSGELGVKVDNSPKPDQHITIHVERQARYIKLSRLLDGNRYRAYVEHVACQNRNISSMPGYRKGGPYMKRLQAGLDHFADKLDRM